MALFLFWHSLVARISDHFLSCIRTGRTQYPVTMFGFSISYSHFFLFTFVLVFICSSYLECRTVPVRRVLPPRPGYIPVYIQHGDSPPDVASLYKSSMTVHHKTSKYPQKNTIYQSGHYLNRSKGNQAQAKRTQGVLHHKAAAETNQYRTNV